MLGRCWPDENNAFLIQAAEALGQEIRATAKLIEAKARLEAKRRTAPSLRSAEMAIRDLAERGAFNDD